MINLVALNRLDEAKDVYRNALERKVDNLGVHISRYNVAFLEGDHAEMDRQIASETGNVGGEPLFLWLASDTAAFSGRLARARELSHRSLELAVHSSAKEWVAEEHLDAALREAEFGESRQANEHIKSALTLASTRDVQTLAALALARAGQNSESQRIADRLAAAYPSNTLLQSYWLPTIRASVEFNRGNAAKAVALLASAEPYELGSFNPLGGTLYPAYVRGEAYLFLRQGKEAVAEFQKFIDHRGVVLNFSPTFPS